MKAFIAVVLVALAAAGAASHAQPKADSVVLVHVHGLAWSADGARLLVPSHFGLAEFKDGRWSNAQGEPNDYMGFAVTRDRFFSSGHPGPGSRLVNPLGLMRSRDAGRSWDALGLQGETDFHLLAAGWNTNAVLVWNPAPSSRLKKAGLHQTLDEGKTWTALPAAGVSGEPNALAAHPTDARTLAVATSTGIYLSNDGGRQFRAIVPGGDGLGMLFDLDGRTLWASVHQGAPKLLRATFDGKAQDVRLPPLANDAVAYVAQNPVTPGRYAIATFQRNVFVSDDAGTSWRQIAKAGRRLDR